MQGAHAKLELFPAVNLQQQGGGAAQSPQGPEVTWVHDIFQGKLVNETRCLQVCCARVYLCV